MNLALWIVAGVLAVMFAGAGVFKLVSTPEKLVESGMGWAADFSAPTVKLIGLLELLGAIGLVVPALVHIAPVLVPLAALGLAATMIGAAVVHARRKETPMIAVNVVLLALALFVAWGRFGPYAFA
ncbi:DoxX family protein [Mycobacterium sp. DL592]|uniref:DoxX family protein n=1 Tax=Mycobacterium sp. DL592 TaxID=2675524 RepID=UPI0014223523|nr:DoxX family protein [Mycobacterium sp. DL592]